MQIRFGALAEPLHKQFDVPPSQLELEQKLADAITLCSVHFVMTDAEVRKARQRLVKLVEKKVNA